MLRERRQPHVWWKSYSVAQVEETSSSAIGFISGRRVEVLVLHQLEGLSWMDVDVQWQAAQETYPEP